MLWSKALQGMAFWRQQRASAWGAMLDRQGLLLAALSRQQAGGVRVVGFHRLHLPDGLVQPDSPRHALTRRPRGRLVQALGRQGRTLALALDADRYRQGVLSVSPGLRPDQLVAEVQLEAAGAWEVSIDEVSFDFDQSRTGGDAGLAVVWAACLRHELRQWQAHVRDAGWQLRAVETEAQALERAVLCWLGDEVQPWAEAPQDWRFAVTAQRTRTAVDWQRLAGWPLQKTLAACGAALGALV